MYFLPREGGQSPGGGVKRDGSNSITHNSLCYRLALVTTKNSQSKQNGFLSPHANTSLQVLKASG